MSNTNESVLAKASMSSTGASEAMSEWRLNSKCLSRYQCMFSIVEPFSHIFQMN